MKSNIKKANKEKRLLNSSSQVTQKPDPQVKATKQRKPRRILTQAYKERILMAYETSNAEERGALLRREGLYCSSIYVWKKEKASGKWNDICRRGRKNAPRIDHLSQENEQLRKKLAQAEAVIELQKKVSELLGQHILPHESNEVNS